MGLRPNRRVWFHGTHADFDDFSHEFSFQTQDLNTRFGFHFASRLDTAWNFGTWLYQKESEPRTGFVMACSLDLRNPMRFADEKHLAAYVRSVGIEAGILPANIMVDAEVEKWTKAEALKWQKDEKHWPMHLIAYYASNYWPALSRAVESLGQGEVLAQEVIRQIKAEGHDGLLYGNTSETEVSRYRETTAVCFEASQIEVLGRAAVDANDEFLPKFEGLEKVSGSWQKKLGPAVEVEAVAIELA